MTLKIALCDDDPVYTDSLKKLLWRYAFSHDIDLSIDEYQEGEQLLGSSVSVYPEACYCRKPRKDYE